MLIALRSGAGAIEAYVQNTCLDCPVCRNSSKSSNYTTGNRGKVPNWLSSPPFISNNKHIGINQISISIKLFLSSLIIDHSCCYVMAHIYFDYMGGMTILRPIYVLVSLFDALNECDQNIFLNPFHLFPHSPTYNLHLSFRCGFKSRKYPEDIQESPAVQRGSGFRQRRKILRAMFSGDRREPTSMGPRRVVKQGKCKDRITPVGPVVC